MISASLQWPALSTREADYVDDKKAFNIIVAFFLASCGNSDFVVESAKVVEIGKEQILEVQISKKIREKITLSGDVLYLDFLKCGENTIIAPGIEIRFVKEIDVYEYYNFPENLSFYRIPAELLQPQSRPLCAKFNRTGYSFGGGGSKVFTISFPAGDVAPN